MKFWDLVIPEPNSGCWLWLGRLGEGYGRFGRSALSHVVAYKAANGSVPDGLVLDHLCRTRCCCNPSHLEAVTIGENVMRGDTISAKYAARDACIHGHPYTIENTRLVDGARICRTCARENTRQYDAKNPRRASRQKRNAEAHRARMREYMRKKRASS